MEAQQDALAQLLARQGSAQLVRGDARQALQRHHLHLWHATSALSQLSCKELIENMRAIKSTRSFALAVWTPVTAGWIHTAPADR